MPWDAQSFAKHNGKFSGKQNAKAAKIANHVLESTGDEGEAIATANKLAKRGIISPKAKNKMQSKAAT